jgi:hypothetical protein
VPYTIGLSAGFDHPELVITGRIRRYEFSTA